MPLENNIKKINSEKSNLWRALFFLAAIILTLVSTLFAIQRETLKDHETRLRIVEKCSIEVSKDIKTILIILEK